MTILEVRVRYIGKDFWVTPDLLGKTVKLSRRDLNVEVRLPLEPADFQPKPDHLEVESTPACYEAQTFVDPQAPPVAIAIRIFVVAVYLEADVPPSQPTPMTQEFADSVSSAAEDGLSVACEVAHDFLRWLRVTSRQEWLGLAVEPPQQYGRAGIYNAETGEGLLGTGPIVSMTWRSTWLALNRSNFESIESSMKGHEEPAIPESLLTDALHLAAGAEVPDSQRAVLVAAMACEIKAKQSVLESCEPDKRDLVSLVLKRVSNAHQVLGDPLTATGRQSLETADRQLYLKIKALVEVRNRIVHAGIAVSEEQARGHIAAARAVFDWIDSWPKGTPSVATVPSAQS